MRFFCLLPFLLFVIVHHPTGVSSSAGAHSSKYVIHLSNYSLSTVASTPFPELFDGVSGGTDARFTGKVWSGITAGTSTTSATADFFTTEFVGGEIRKIALSRNPVASKKEIVETIYHTRKNNFASLPSNYVEIVAPVDAVHIATFKAIFICDYRAHRILKLNYDDADPTVHKRKNALSIFAGSENKEAGLRDAVGLSARFSNPLYAAYHPEIGGPNLLYISDYGNCVLRKIDVSVGSTSVFASSPSGTCGYSNGDSKEKAVYFNRPAGLALLRMPTGTNNFVLAVADRSNHLIRRVSLSGYVALAFGKQGVCEHVDGKFADGRLCYPTGMVAYHADPGMVYFTDFGYRVIRKCDMQLREVRTIAGNGNRDHIDSNVEGKQAAFPGPGGIAVFTEDSSLLVADADATIRRVKVTIGTHPTTTVLGDTIMTHRNGFGDEARLNFPTDIIIDPSNEDRFLIVDHQNYRIRSAKRWTQEVKDFAGTGKGEYRTGPALQTPLACIAIVGYERLGEVYVGSATAILRIANGNIYEFAGGSSKGFEDSLNSLLSARFDTITGLAIESLTNFMYVSDHTNRVLRRLKVGGIGVGTCAGKPGENGYVDGEALTKAQFRSPRSLVFPHRNNTHLFIADPQSHAIRLFLQEGNLKEVQTFIGGTQRSGYLDGPRRSAQVLEPCGLTVSPPSILFPKGQLFITDGLGYIVRRVDMESEIVTTIAGGPSSMGRLDGIGPSAQMTSLLTAYFHDGQLLVVDPRGSNIREVGLDGIVSTFVGPHGLGYGRVNRERTVCTPRAVASLIAKLDVVVQGDGENDSARTNSSFTVTKEIVLFTDMCSHWVKQISFVPSNGGTMETQKVSVFAGQEKPGFKDGAMNLNDISSSPQFNSPSGLIYVESKRQLLVADRGNHLIRSISVDITASSNNNPASTTPSPTVKAKEIRTISGIAGKRGYVNGASTVAKFNYPSSVDYFTYLVNESATKEEEMNVFVIVADTHNHCIRGISINTKDAANAETFTIAGSPDRVNSDEPIANEDAVSRRYRDGDGNFSRFFYPLDVTVASDRLNVRALPVIYVADTHNRVIRKITLTKKNTTASNIPARDFIFSSLSWEVSTIAGEVWNPSAATYSATYPRGYQTPSTSTAFEFPISVCLDPMVQRLYVADLTAHTVKSINLQTGDVDTLLMGEGSAGTSVEYAKTSTDAANFGENFAQRIAFPTSLRLVMRTQREEKEQQEGIVRRSLLIADSGNHRIGKLELALPYFTRSLSRSYPSESISDQTHTQSMSRNNRSTSESVSGTVDDVGGASASLSNTESYSINGAQPISSTTSMTSKTLSAVPYEKENENKKKQTGGVRAIAEVVPGEGAEVIVGSGATSGALSGVVSPTAASGATRGAQMFKVISCGYSEADEGEEPSPFEHPFPVQISSENGDEKENEIMEKFVGSGITTACIFILFPFFATKILLLWAARQSMLRWGKTQGYILAPLNAMCLNYFLPCVVNALFFVVFHAASMYFRFLAIGFLILSALPFLDLVYHLMWSFTQRYEKNSKKWEPLPSISETTTTTTGDSKTKEEEKGEERREMGPGGSKQNSNVSHEAWRHAYAIWLDGCRKPESWYVRIYAIEDALTANIVAFCVSIRPGGSSCGAIAILILLVAVLHTVYVCLIRPYRSRIETIFTIVISLVQCILGLLCTVIAFRTTTQGDDDWLLSALAVVGVAQNVLFFIQIAALAFWAYTRKSKKEIMSASEGENGKMTNFFDEEGKDNNNNNIDFYGDEDSAVTTTTTTKGGKKRSAHNNNNNNGKMEMLTVPILSTSNSAAAAETTEPENNNTHNEGGSSLPSQRTKGNNVTNRRKRNDVLPSLHSEEMRGEQRNPLEDL